MHIYIDIDQKHFGGDRVRLELYQFRLQQALRAACFGYRVEVRLGIWDRYEVEGIDEWEVRRMAQGILEKVAA